MNLYCPTCDTTTFHTVRPWQTSPSIFGAVSVLCYTCGRLEIHELGKGYLIELPDAATPSAPATKEK